MGSSNQDKTVTLSFDWNALGISPDQATLEMPEVADFQTAGQLQLQAPVPVKSKEGCLLLLKKK